MVKKKSLLQCRDHHSAVHDELIFTFQLDSLLQLDTAVYVDFAKIKHKVLCTRGGSVLRQCKAQNLSTASAKSAVQSVLATYACTLVRQALHDCTNVAIVCNVGNPSRVENVSIVDFHKFSFAVCSRSHCNVGFLLCPL